MRKKIICLIIAITGTAITAEAQSLSELKDNCYSYLASHDTAAFNATFSMQSRRIWTLKYTRYGMN